ncbi:MAG TPA: fused MFS/spermidine synthase [Povalibacter sp.]|nr:fused MFS/spermidine synthase [Povalibacter sp.]
MSAARALLFLAAICAMTPAAASAQTEQQLLHSERSLYREVMVYQKRDLRCMCFTRNCRVGRQSCMDVRAPDQFVLNYTRMMMGSLYVKPQPQSILIIGLGGGTLPRALAQILPQAVIDVVEIDPAVVRVAAAYFDFHVSDHVRVTEMDGRVFVRRALRGERRYDLIMLDAFDHEYIPEHLLTQEFLREVKRLLAPGGVVAANTFSSSRLYDHESVTYASVYGTFFNLKRENRVIIAAEGPLPSAAVLQANSAIHARELTAFGVDAEQLLPLFAGRPDWNPRARILTDQYSPANLLNLGDE